MEGEREVAGIELLEFAARLWRRRLLVGSIVVIFVVCGVSYALTAEKWFRAQTVLTPRDSKSMPSGLGSLAGLAGLAGISLPMSSSAEALATLRSADFIREFIQDKKLLPVLFDEQWDAASGTWKAKYQDDPPDIRDALKLFVEDVRVVTEDKKSGLVTLTVQWKDPLVAAEWANDLVKRLNEKMRAKALVESERNVAHLQDELTKNPIATLQQSLGRVLESEMQKLMVAKGTEDYSYKVIDVATPPKKRYRPQRTIIVILSGLAGFLMASLFVMMQESLSAHSRRLK